MWYDNRARYDQMARRIAKGQLFCSHEDSTPLGIAFEKARFVQNAAHMSD